MRANRITYYVRIPPECAEKLEALASVTHASGNAIVIRWADELWRQMRQGTWTRLPIPDRPWGMGKGRGRGMGVMKTFRLPPETLNRMEEMACAWYPTAQAVFCAVIEAAWQERLQEEEVDSQIVREWAGVR